MTTSKRDYTLSIQGITPGTHTYKFEVEDSFFTQVEGCEITKGHCEVTIELERSTHLTTLSSSIKGKVTLPCDRCLEDIELPIAYEGKLYLKFSADVEESYLDVGTENEDIMWLNPKENQVDLTQYLYDCINMALPLQRIHGVDEKGEPLCDPDMLSRFGVYENDPSDGLEFIDDEDENE